MFCWMERADKISSHGGVKSLFIFEMRSSYIHSFNEGCCAQKLITNSSDTAHAQEFSFAFFCFFKKGAFHNFFYEFDVNCYTFCAFSLTLVLALILNLWWFYIEIQFSHFFFYFGFSTFLISHEFSFELQSQSQFNDFDGFHDKYKNHFS